MTPKPTGVAQDAQPADAQTPAQPDTLTVSRELLESLVDEGPCYFDHHGGCQGHGYLGLQPGELCPQYELKVLLGIIGADQ